MNPNPQQTDTLKQIQAAFEAAQGQVSDLRAQVEHMAGLAQAKVAQKYPGMTGASSNAVVIDPGPHGDGMPWPYGIWIKPPVSLDTNVITLGTSDLPDSATLSARLARGFDDSVGTVLELLMTPRFIRQL